MATATQGSSSPASASQAIEGAKRWSCLEGIIAHAEQYYAAGQISRGQLESIVLQCWQRSRQISE